MRCILAKNAFPHSGSYPIGQGLAGGANPVERKGVFLTGKRARLKARQTVLDNCQQIVIKHARNGRAKASRPMLKLNQTSLVRAAKLNCIQVGRTPCVRVLLV